MPFISSAGRRGFRTPKPSGGGTPNYGSLKIKVIGDSSVATVATNLQSAFTSLGYTGSLTFSSSHMNGTYTGSDLTTANYDVAIVYMNGGLNTSTVGTNLNSFVTAGGKLITATFVWNITITGFTYTNTPWIYSGSQGSTASTTYTKDISHPITDTLSTNLVTTTFWTNNSLNLQSGATKIATLADTKPFISVWDKGTARLVGINYFPPQNNAIANRLIVRAIGWCMSKI